MQRRRGPREQCDDDHDGDDDGDNDDNDDDHVVTTATSHDDELAGKLTSMLGVTGVDAMLLPYAQRLLVGYFSTEVTAFAWDICLLAGWQTLQHVLASSLICMREGLLTCADVQTIKGFIATQAPLLNIDQMQRCLNEHFMPDIRKALNAPPQEQAFELTPGGSWT